MNLVEGLKKRGVTPLKKNSICNTLTSIPDDYIHYDEPRIMTVREHARIQSFPDDYEFKGPYTTGVNDEKRMFLDILKSLMLFHLCLRNKLDLLC